MEAAMLYLILIFGPAALGLASQIWGADSREPYQDDHIR